MPYYAHHQTILGTDSSVDGSPHDYGTAPGANSSWSYSGNVFTHVVYEATAGAYNYNGDSPNEEVYPSRAVGGSTEQSTVINGTAVSILYDFAFYVTDGTNTYEIGVLDADMNADGHLNDPNEDGYYLIFIGDVPPPNTDLTVTNDSVENSDARTHASLGGEAVCFAAGTLISTRQGDVPVEALRVGDEVLTLDYGYQPVRWHRARRLPPAELRRAPHLRPIRICAGALGVNTPARDLLVSPQHRMLVRSVVAQRMFDAQEILVAAKHLLELDGVEIATERKSVTYCHFMFERHQVVFANGAPSESFYPGPMALKTVGAAAREEIMSIFCDVDWAATGPTPSARTLTPGARARQFARRLRKNNKPAVDVEMG